MSSDDAVQKIKDTLNIIDVIQPYVALSQAGRHFKGKSPFTEEKTPSFYVSPDRGMYYCFSTNQGGDMFTFVQKMEGVDFKEALKMLAEKANVELTAMPAADRSYRDTLFTAMEEARAFYHEQLAKNSTARSYLEKRGITEFTIKEWQIGYAPGPPDGGWRELREHLNKKQVADTTLLATGLIKQPDKGKDPFDVFRDRIVFPMNNAQGKVVAFSGRILHPNDKSPKYVNSPETELYKKSELLFGYDKAKHSLRKLPFWLIVEGQFDVVWCHQAGYSNAVAVSGTALTEFHIRQLERLCKQVVLVLDSDRAGIVATKKSAELMLRRGMDVKVAHLPDGKDPADILNEDIAIFKKAIKEAKHTIVFLLQHLKNTITDERKLRLRVGEEILPFVILLPNEIDKEYFIEEIANEINTSKEALYKEIEKITKRELESIAPPKSHVPQSVTTTTSTTASHTKTQKYALSVYVSAVLVLKDEAFKTRVAEVVKDILDIDLETVSSSVEQNEIDKCVFELEKLFASFSDKQLAEEIQYKINQFLQIYGRSLTEEYKTSLQQVEASGGGEEAKKILGQVQVLQKKLMTLPIEI